MGRLNLGALRDFNLKHALKLLAGALTEGWYVKGERVSEDRRRLLMCNYTSNIIANLVGGTFWTGFLLLVNASDAFIGTMTMIATAANMLQFIAPLLLERFPKRKKLLTSLRGAMYLLNVVFIAVIPLFPAANQLKLTLIGGTVLIVNIANALMAPGLTIWHLQSVPHNVRPFFYSIVTMTVGAVVALFNLAGSAIVDALTAAGNAYMGFTIVRGMAAVLCVIELILYSRIKEYKYEGAGAGFKLRDLVKEPLRHKIYLRTVAVTFLWNITANIPGSYYTVYLLKNLEVSYSYIIAISMVNIPIVLLLTPIWRRVLSKFGWFKTLYVAVAAYIVHYILLALVTKGTMFIYPLSQILAYLFAVGINLSFTGIPYVNMPEKNQTVFMGFYSSMANLAAFLGVTLGKRFVLITEDMRITIGGLTIMNKQALMLVTAALMLITVIGVWLIDKKTPREDG